MTTRTATLIGSGAILLWSLLALFTAASGAVPPGQLATAVHARTMDRSTPSQYTRRSGDGRVLEITSDPTPEVADAVSLRTALLMAEGIYFPDPVKATAGIHFASVVDRLGIRHEVEARFRTFHGLHAVADGGFDGEFGLLLLIAKAARFSDVVCQIGFRGAVAQGQ